MDPSKTPSWGAPASGASQTSQQGPRKNNPFVQSGQPQNINRHQRQSPYQINAGRGKNGSPNNFQERGDDTVEKSFLSFSSSNPFNDQGKKFSNENPFHKNISNSPGNSFLSRSQYHSPNLSFQQHPRFQSSPNQRGFPPRFSPQTSLKNFNTPSRRFETSSSGGYSNSASHHCNSSKKPFFQRNNSLNNPGGSDNIKDYIHPSMLEDPWKNLPATPMFQSY